VSSRLPSREHAIQLLRINKCPNKVFKHCLVVADLALEMGSKLKNRGFDVDLQLVEIGALLHDIGRAKTHSVHHAIVGSDIAKKSGLPSSVISIIRRHVGGGIIKKEAEELGWPRDEDYVPVTLEEKLVSYADKLVQGSKRVSISVVVEELKMELKPEASERVTRLHEEISMLLGK
jgi:uncharacterized protein